MLTFKPIEKDKIDLYREYYNDDNAIGCEFNFVSGYLWNEEYQLRVAFYDDTLIKAYFRPDGRVWGYCMPRGKNVKGAVEAVFDDASKRGQDVSFAYMSLSEKEELETLFPNRFTFKREPDNQDYIYLSRDLATLEGKKYHAKRSHISKFYRTYSDSVCFKTLVEDNIDDAKRVMNLWCEENGINPAALGEYKVFLRACTDFSALKMQGAVLYVEKNPVAVTMGSEISAGCFDVMFEKALREYDGVYAVINNEFAKTLTRYKYINREEDMGLEGLRKSKLSYHPAIIYDRFSAKPI